VPTPFRGPSAASDEVLRTRTGRDWAEWFAILEAWGAAERSHPEIARWLSAEHGVDGWWAQELTVGYEMATGRRQPGQRPEGFSATASKTMGVQVATLYRSWVDDDARRAWLPDVPLRLRTATPHRTARFDVADGDTRLVMNFTDKGAAKSSVAMEHERLPDADAAAERKAFWRERLVALKRHLES
jgi:hypothetical protein